MPKAPFGDLLQYLRRMYPAEDGGGRTDGELLNRFVTEHEEDAFTVLVRRHGSMVLGVCQRLLADLHLAEDAFQATFIVLARRAATIRSRTSLGTWLYTVAQRVAMKARAKAKAWRTRERESGNMPRTERSGENTWQELRSIIDEEIGRLPEKYQGPLVLCCLESKSHDRAAKELGCAKTTLERRLSRGREVLRRQLIRRGVTLSAGVLGTALCEKVMGAPAAALLTVNTVKAAARVLAGKAIAGGCLTARALALAEEAMVGMASVKGKLVVIVLALGLAVGGAGWAGYGVLGEKSQAASAATAQAPTAKGQAADAAKKDLPIAIDQYGDPLPEGAVARLGALRFRHEGWANRLVFTADGKTLVGSTLSGVLIWDATTGKERFRLPVLMPHWSRGMDVSPDATTLAVSETVPEDDEIKITLWDINSGKKTRILSLPGGKAPHA
ncbi:MAG TPA: sigma-70 family RNA polymerase sigma factor, partial [Gemmataceae bacterium]|nr:sigma-70 family RNA polymerase sigma factor [Gemmataceae bacterium]